MNKAIDNGILFLQCINTKIRVKEETQQVRHYHICSKCEKTEENKGCTGKKTVFLKAGKPYLRGRWVSIANKMVGCDWSLVVPLILHLSCADTYLCLEIW